MSVSTNGQIGHSAGKDLTGGNKGSGSRNSPYRALSKDNSSVTDKAPGKYGKPGPDYAGEKFMPSHVNQKSGSYGSQKCKAC